MKPGKLLLLLVLALSLLAFGALAEQGAQTLAGIALEEPSEPSAPRDSLPKSEDSSLGFSTGEGWGVCPACGLPVPEADAGCPDEGDGFFPPEGTAGWMEGAEDDIGLSTGEGWSLCPACGLPVPEADAGFPDEGDGFFPPEGTEGWMEGAEDDIGFSAGEGWSLCPACGLPVPGAEDEGLFPEDCLDCAGSGVSLDEVGEDAEGARWLDEGAQGALTGAYALLDELRAALAGASPVQAEALTKYLDALDSQLQALEYGAVYE